jgi:hypothetical protein
MVMMPYVMALLLVQRSDWLSLPYLPHYLLILIVDDDGEDGVVDVADEVAQSDPHM